MAGSRAGEFAEVEMVMELEDPSFYGVEEASMDGMGNLCLDVK